MEDKIYHMLCADEQVQVCAIDGLQMVRRMRELHNTSRVATAALGRQLMMTSMMGSRLKNADDRVSTIIKGDGYAGSMVCTAMPGGKEFFQKNTTATVMIPGESRKYQVAAVLQISAGCARSRHGRYCQQ